MSYDLEISGTGVVEDGVSIFNPDLWKLAVAAQARANDETIRMALGHWVSEEEPAIVYDCDGFLVGISSERLCRLGYPAHLIIRFTR